MIMAKWIHSVPAWTLGPRAANAKFGGNIVLNGIPDVQDRLLAITQFSRSLGMAGEYALLTSGHLMLEIKTRIPRLKKFNADGAISVKDLKAGIRAGMFPRILAITAPQFGFKGAERGGMISEDTVDEDMAFDLHVEAIELATELKEQDMGEGVTIWWPAFTSRSLNPLGRGSLPFNKACDMMLEFWVSVLGKTGGVMHLEWKPCDPGIDYLCTIALAIDFCNKVNKILKRRAMVINNEFAHILLQGIPVAEGMRQTIVAGLFTGFVHTNSNLMYPVNIQALIDSGIAIEKVLGGMDLDWPVGVGGQAIWDDQQSAISMMDKSGVSTVFCEHDLNPAGEDPFEVHKLSIENVVKMLKATRRAPGAPPWGD